MRAILVLGSVLLWCMLACCLGESAAAASPYPPPGLQRQDGWSRWSGVKDRASAPNTNLSTWMGDMSAEIGSLTLKELILPGTHDSGAFELTNQLAPDITGSDFLNSLITLAESLGVAIEDVITPWALSQTLDFLGQAEAGVRYFDLRVCWNGSEFVTYHFETGRPILELLGDLATFTTANPAEIIVVEAQVWSPHNQSDAASTEQKRAFVAEVLALFPEGSLYPEEASFNSTYAQLVAWTQRILFSVNDPTMYEAGSDAQGRQVLWWGPGGPSSSGGGPTPPQPVIWNTYANTHELAIMEAFDTAQVQQFNNATTNNNSSNSNAPPSCGRDAASGSDACLFKVSWTLTTDAGAIFGSLQPGNPRSLIEMASVANAQLDAFATQPWIAHPTNGAPPLRLGNILIGDDIANSPLIEIAIQENKNTARRLKQRQQQQQLATGVEKDSLWLTDN